MIALVGNSLHQWDLGREVELTGPDAAATEVHFAQFCGGSRALVVEARLVGPGVRRAWIPNVYLQRSLSVCAWTWRDDRTISGSRFPVHSRPRPLDYTYEPTTVIDYEDLRQWVLDLLQDLMVEGTSDYELLAHKPKINHVELVGDRRLDEIGIDVATDLDIDGLFAV